MSKYYICNDIKFLTGMGCGNTTPDTGTHYKMADADNFVKSHKGYTYIKVRNSSKGNDYVICTPMRFVGNDLNIVNTIKQAKWFETPEDAYCYLDAYSSRIPKDIYLVIDEKYRRKKRVGAAAIADPVEVYNYTHMDSSERILIPKSVKDSIYAKSGEICPICGMKMSKYNYTIDHIVPLSRGGTNEVDNLRAVHKECNRLKGNFTDNEFFKTTASVVCNQIYRDPASNMASILARSFVRGVINKYNIEVKNTLLDTTSGGSSNE